MECLSDAVIQAVADNEAPVEAREHAASCASCGQRVRVRGAQLHQLPSLRGTPARMRGALERGVEQAVAGTASSGGATRLRPGARAGRQWSRTGWGTAAVAAATLIAVFVIVPLLKSPTTVSAAEILAKSADKLAERASSGVELLEYELTLDGVPREMMPDRENGTY